MKKEENDFIETENVSSRRHQCLLNLVGGYLKRKTIFTYCQDLPTRETNYKGKNGNFKVHKDSGITLIR